MRKNYLLDAYDSCACSTSGSETELPYRNGTITVFFFAADKKTKTIIKFLSLPSYNKCLRKILKVYWPMMKISKEEIRESSGTRTVDDQVRTKRWKWLGHVLKMPSDKFSKIALTWAPEGKRRRGRPRETWRRTVNKERKHLGFKTWRHA